MSNTILIRKKKLKKLIKLAYDEDMLFHSLCLNFCNKRKNSKCPFSYQSKGENWSSSKADKYCKKHILKGVTLCVNQ